MPPAREDEVTPPAQSAVAVARRSLPRRRRADAGSEEEEEEPLSSDEEWWGSDDEYLAVGPASPVEALAGGEGPGGEEDVRVGNATDGGARWREGGREGGGVWEQQSTVETAGLSGLSLKRPAP